MTSPSSDFSELQRSIARVSSFQGYRAIPVVFSGGVAVAAGILQWLIAPSPMSFVVLWSLAACVGFGGNLWCIARQYGASPRKWERSLAFAALTDLSPAVLAGMLLTIALAVRGQVELLPGLWMVLFGTGVMASRRHLPVHAIYLGAGYVLAGTLALAILEHEKALRAEVMAGVFGVGQWILAYVISRSAR